MIHVQGLTRHYGPTTAIQNLDFHVNRGEVVGFLGLNGAGKTTTMRILAGALGASAGQATVGGHDVRSHSQQVKGIVGYLPELPPLHMEMSVRGYLAHVARLKGVAVTPAVDEVITQTSLGDVAHRLIGHLSKGYRQRVGLAQALVHKPPVLILDEPSTGLDPAQRQEIRSLILELASESRTVLLSTHLLAEVESICTRVLVIHQGRLVAQEDMSTLQTLQIKVARPGPATLQDLESVASSVVALDDGCYQVPADTDRESLSRAAVEHGLLEMTTRHRLEERFLRLTRGETS